MKIFLAKQLFRDNDIKFNYEKIIDIYNQALSDDCDFLIFSEMAISGFPIYDSLLDANFLKKSDGYVEKIIDYTKGKKTRILLGCPYSINSYTTEDGIIKGAKLFNSVILISDGYIDGVSSKTNILKNNLFDEYKYFDKEVILKNITYENDNFDVLIGDDIMENENIFFIKERDTDFIICLDTELSKNIEFKKNQLIKIAKWTKKNVFYLNTIGYDFKNYYKFLGEIFLVDNSGNIIFSDISINENIVKFETKIVNGKFLIQPRNSNNKKDENIINIVADSYKNANFIYEIKNKNQIKKTKNLKLITFEKSEENDDVEFIDIDKYLKNSKEFKLDHNFKKLLVENIFNKYIYVE